MGMAGRGKRQKVSFEVVGEVDCLARDWRGCGVVFCIAWRANGCTCLFCERRGTLVLHCAIDTVRTDNTQLTRASMNPPFDSLLTFSYLRLEVF